MTDDVAWNCTACGEPLPGGKAPCPKCGGTARTAGKLIQAQAEPVAMVRMRKEDRNLPRKKQPRVDQMIGRELRRSVGDLVHKFRRVDREAGTYTETITDKDGNLIHHQNHPIADHKGHGSDKR